MSLTNSHFKDTLSVSAPPSAGLSATPSTTPSGAGGHVDVFLLTFFLLLETTNLTSNSALIRSKQLKQNALDEERINSEMGQLKNFTVPNRITNVYVHKHMHGDGGGDGPHFVYATYTQEVTYPNVGAIQQAGANNQEISAQRGILSDQLNRLQQSAQVAQTNVNTISDSAMQSMQEDSYLLQALQSLTFKALMRQEPQ